MIAAEKTKDARSLVTCDDKRMPRSWFYGLAALLSGHGAPELAEETDHAHVYAAMLLVETREEIDRADFKASVLLAGVGVATGTLLAGLLEGSWTPWMLPGYVQWIWWVGVAAGSAGIWSLARAVYPRIRRHGEALPEFVGYFGDILAFRDAEDLITALRDSTEVRISLIADQLVQVSIIVDRKYRMVRVGMWLLLVAILSCSTALFLETLVRQG
jgi:pycsar effector protein